MFRFLSNITYRIQKYYYLKKYGKYEIPVVKGYWKCFYKYAVHDAKKDKIINEVCHNNAFEIISDFADCGLYFPYQHRGIKKMDVELGMNSGDHCHSIDQLFLDVYLYPESFEVEEQFKDCYSSAELKCIDKIKKKCKEKGLKDVIFYDEKNNIYTNYMEEYQKRGMKPRRQIYDRNSKYILKYKDYEKEIEISDEVAKAGKKKPNN